MHFDQQTITRISEAAKNLERARVRLDSAQKSAADWEVIQKLQTEFDALQETMVNIGIQATQTLPRSVKDEAAQT